MARAWGCGPPELHAAAAERAFADEVVEKEERMGVVAEQAQQRVNPIAAQGMIGRPGGTGAPGMARRKSAEPEPKGRDGLPGPVVLLGLHERA